MAALLIQVSLALNECICGYEIGLLPACHVRKAPGMKGRAHGAGLGASELYVVKSGEFEVLERRQGINMRVNRKARGDCFGEVSLMYSCPRSATVAALQDSVVWVLERQVFRSGRSAHPTKKTE